MSYITPNTSHRAVATLHWIATITVATLAVSLAALTLAGFLGWLPLLRMPLQFGDTTHEAGGFVQTGLSILLLLIAACLPSGWRVLALERTHRDFSISMSDVAEAYRICHAADRGDAFTLREQFDAVKERILYLRRHPDLGHLEPDVLETAAEMSYASRELADTYGDENLARARSFLAQRREEIAQFEERIDSALAACKDLRRERDTVTIEEEMQQSRLSRMAEEYGDLLAELGFTRPRARVVALPSKPVAAE
ncbi:DNA repair protein [Palleronia sp. LCG004]|uniref:DNA repair protein n=1 Tax=Palleronia sp. LCG004 TaxID=3079304 RepID=UPI002941BD8C|nr:DNA repair protein [Palleronia sp. LCG004]WOI57320.1 DNA repair protein [Palleronia sp. LCG004]